MTQRACSKMMSLRRPRRRRSTGGEAPRGRSRRVKKTAIRGSPTASSLGGGPILVADFDRSEWEIMYLCYVESGLVDLSNRTDN
jgi:hypothetical protein